MPAAGQTFARVLLGARLTAYREAAGVTTQAVEDAGVTTKPNLWRIETGQMSISPDTISTLATLYRLSTDERRTLQHLAQATTTRGAWWPFRDDLPVWSRLYVDAEVHASNVTIWQDGVIPGELQTEQYAQACAQAARPEMTPSAIGAVTRIRLQRQHNLLERHPGAQVSAIIGESALRRQAADHSTTGRQLEHLRQLNERDNLDIRYLPFAAGALPAITAAFRILTVAGPAALTWVYLETPTSATYLDKISDVHIYQAIYRDLARRAEPITHFAA